MSKTVTLQTPSLAANSPPSGHLLQRACACGRAAGLSGECEECKTKKLLGKPLRTKLAVSQPGDEFEQEADRIAEQVLKMPERRETAELNETVDRPLVQRQASASTATTAEYAPPIVRRRVDGFSGTGAGLAPSIVMDVLASPGRPLGSATRGFFEPRFGHNFSNVRVHSGPLAEQSAREVNAHAYTVGQHIVFGMGKLAPETQDGRRLLAHEMMHVVQQHGTGLRLARQKASLAEKWDAFWGAGPIDAKRAAELSKEALREAGRVAAEMGLAPASLHNGPPDAWRHCYWNCRMVQVIGKEDAADIAHIHEEHGGNPVAERMMDDWNNEEGRSCSGDCDTCCQQKLDTGKLWVLYGGKVGASKPMPRTPGAIPSGGKYEKY